MDHIGIDVHKRESQICILAEGGELIEQRIRTEPERFAAVLGKRPRARIHPWSRCPCSSRVIAYTPRDETSSRFERMAARSSARRFSQSMSS